jgi:hypothetical protein
MSDKRRPASFAQCYRLNTLGCFRLVEPGQGEPVDFHTAYKVLRDAAAAGLFTPARDDDSPSKKRGQKNSV